MEREIREDRKAYRREQVQRCREYISKRDIVWLVDRLIDAGPATEHQVALWAVEEAKAKTDDIDIGTALVVDSLVDLQALWAIGKLWRRRAGIHPGSGQQSYLYGIRRVHSPNTKASDATHES